MSSNNKKDISVSTIRNSDGELISSQSIDGIKYYTYKFHLFILSESTRNFINRLQVNGSYLLKDWIYFVEMKVLQAPSAGDINGIVTGSTSNLRWENGNGTGKDLFEIITTSRINLFEIKVSYPQWHAGWCIYEDDVLVFKDVVNGGTGNTPSNAYYYYPLNNGTLPNKLLPIETSVGQGWRLIRHLPPNSIRWFPGSTSFSEINDDEELLFTTGDFTNWFITTRYTVCGSYTNSNGDAALVPAIDSNFGQTNIQIHYRLGVSRDPTIKLRNQSNVNVRRMYTEDVNNENEISDIHSSGMYVYARFTKLSITKLNLIFSQIGTGWNLIRHISSGSSTFFQGDTNFSEINNDDELLFTTGDTSTWLITTRFTICGNFVNGTYHTAIKSSRSDKFQVYFRSGVSKDPLVRWSDQWMYYEDSTTDGINHIHPSGMYVYSRPRQIVRYPGKYKQKTINYNDITNPTETYVNVLTGNYIIDSNGTTVENVINYKNEVINIISTSVPDNDNIITIINEDKLTNIKTTTRKENNAIQELIKNIIVENPQDSLGVQITTEDNFETNQKTIVTTNHIDKSEFAIKTVDTVLSDGSFISWFEDMETYVNEQGHLEFVRNIKNESGTLNEKVQIITTIIDDINDTKTIQTVNTTDQTEFTKKFYVTLLSNNEFVRWKEILETTVSGNVEGNTIIEKDSNGTILYIVNNNQKDATISDGSYPVLNINDSTFTLSQLFQPYNEIIHTQKYEPTNTNFIEDRLILTHRNDSSKFLEYFRFKEYYDGSAKLSGYIMTENTRAQILLREYVKLKDTTHNWFISFIYHPTSSVTSYNRLFDILWNKAWPGAGTTQTGMQIVGRNDNKIEIRWYQNSSGNTYNVFVTRDSITGLVFNQDNVVTIEVENSSTSSRWRTSINNEYGWYRDVPHYNATDSGTNLVYIREIRHADIGTGYHIKDVIYGRYTKNFDNRNMNYIRTLNDRRHTVTLQDIDIYNSSLI